MVVPIWARNISRRLLGVQVLMSDTETTEPMYWLWPDGDGFLIFPTRYPAYENGDPKVYGEPAAGPLSLHAAQRFVEAARAKAA